MLFFIAFTIVLRYGAGLRQSLKREREGSQRGPSRILKTLQIIVFGTENPCCLCPWTPGTCFALGASRITFWEADALVSAKGRPVAFSDLEI